MTHRLVLVVAVAGWRQHGGIRGRAERKRRILVITPANLRQQWFQELTEKFFLPCRILEAKSDNAAIKQGQFRPFDGPEIVICSYQFARSKATDVHAVPWDMVLIDEAHRLRNVYKLSLTVGASVTRSPPHRPGVQFSRIRFLDCTRFRVEQNIHAYTTYCRKVNRRFLLGWNRLEDLRLFRRYWVQWLATDAPAAPAADVAGA